MRILVISYEYPPVGGGGSDVGHYIARELASKGHAVRFLTAHCTGLPFFERVDSFEVRRIRSFRQRPGGCSIPEMFAFGFLACLHGTMECLRFKPDLVHVHHAVPDGPIGYWLGLLFRKPYVMTAHGGDIPGHIPALDGLFRKIHFACRIMWGKAAANVVVADHLLELARKAYPDACARVIPNGVDTEKYRPPKRKPQNQTIRILYAGRFHEEKNVSLLIRCIPEIRALTSTPFRLVLFGSGQDQADLIQLTEELGVADIVDFPGWVGRDEIITAFQQGDIFALPSRVEGMPISCIQAMACGLPIVASDIPGTRLEVADGKTGFLVPVNDVKAFAASLAILIDSPEKRTLFGHNGRKRSESLFSWKTIGKQYEDLFYEILCKQPKPGVGIKR